MQIFYSVVFLCMRASITIVRISYGNSVCLGVCHVVPFQNQVRQRLGFQRIASSF